MNKNFTLDNWLKTSFEILKLNWLLWIIVSIASSIIITAVLFTSLREVVPKVIELSQTLDVNPIEGWKEIAFQMLGIAGVYLVGFILLFAFIELFVVLLTSHWYLKKEFTIEAIAMKALSNLPIAIIQNIIYLILLIIAFFFCLIPAIFVVVFFLFLSQALIIEDKGLGSFGRSIEIVKQNFGTFLVIPFLLSFVFQFANMIPFSILQSFLEALIPTEQVSNLPPLEIFNSFFSSPAMVISIFLGVFVFSLESNLKTILYTIAFEEARKEVLM